jgi:hypothetical protein
VSDLPDGWGPSLPRTDTLLREFVETYADLAEGLGRAGQHPTTRSAELVAFDSHSPFEFFNVAVPLRPLHSPDDPLVDEIAEFFAPDDENTPFLIYCGTPTPDLRSRGWTLMGHPPCMLRPAAPVTPPAPEGLEILEVRDESTLEVVDRTLVEAYPIPQLRGRRTFSPGLLDVPGFRVWLGVLDGEPVGTAAAHVSDALVDVEWISTKSSARGRRIGEALTWAATLAAPELPAMLIASDLGQPTYERMGYLRLARFTLWVGARSARKK